MWRMTSETTNVLALILIIIAIFLLLLLCVLSVFFCRKSRSSWAGESSILPPPGFHHDDSSCFNDGFDLEFADETCPRRIEERRRARHTALYCEDPRADLNLNRLDPSVGAALAVEQLLRDSYVFDTRMMPKPSGDVKVIAAKRDYL